MSEHPVEAATAAPGEKRSAGRPRKEPGPVPRYAKASESGDPAIQKLLADRWTAEQAAAQAASDAETAEAVRGYHEDHVAARTQALNDLGFE